MLALIIAVFLLSPTAPGDDLRKTNEYVDVQWALRKKEVRAGDSTTLLISFTPRRGIHITGNPKMEVTLDTLTQFFSTRASAYAKDTKGYLDTTSPVSRMLSIARSTPPGAYVVRGTLTYYYCSDDQGWCSRFRQPFNLTFTVTK